MEVAQYGDTEILATELKTTVEKLKQCDKDTMKCKMDDDFEVTNLQMYIIFENNYQLLSTSFIWFSLQQYISAYCFTNNLIQYIIIICKLSKFVIF